MSTGPEPKQIGSSENLEFKKNKDNEKIKTNNYDLVISDLRIIEDNGQETSGLDILKEVKNKNSKTPVIIITAYSDVESGLQSIEWGAYEYISKPFKIQEIRMAAYSTALSILVKLAVPCHAMSNAVP